MTGLEGIDGLDFQRARTREQLLGFQRCASIGFQHRMPDSERWIDGVLERIDELDHRIAVDGDRVVGTFLSFDQELTAVGGARVPVRAVSAVTVLPTHRRRGILGRHMRGCLDAAAGGGAAAATLIAAEYAIYGRYGFGPGTEVADYRIAVDRARLPQPPRDEVRYADGAEYLDAAALVRLSHDAPGRVSVPELSARRAAGLLAEPGAVPDREAGVQRAVLRRAGEPVGVLAYDVTGKWDDSRPDSTLNVRELLAVDFAAERDLWAFAMSIDWIRRVHAGARPLDDLVTAVPADPRAVQITNRSDLLWLRPLDVPALLRARGYAVPGRLVLDVTDPGWGAGRGPAHGRFLIEADGAGARAERTGEAADLALDVTEFGRVWLSDSPVSRRVAAGAVRELTDGAAARADLMLFSPRRPWAVEHF